MTKDDKIMLELAGIRGDMAIISYYLQGLSTDKKAKEDLKTVFDRSLKRYEILTKNDDKKNTNN